MKKLFSSKYSDNGIAIATLALRLTLGVLVIPHGYDKLMHFAGMSSKFIDPFHLGPTVSMALVIFAELFCGALIVMGLMTRFACIPLIISMSVAVLVAHHGHIFKEGQPAALYLGGFITLLFTGPGKISLDRLIGK
jgi:putative oxidoreductase